MPPEQLLSPQDVRLCPCPCPCARATVAPGHAVCSFVRAAGRVSMGGKVLVWVSFRVLLCSGAYAGPLHWIGMF